MPQLSLLLVDASPSLSRLALSPVEVSNGMRVKHRAIGIDVVRQRKVWMTMSDVSYTCSNPLLSLHMTSTSTPALYRVHSLTREMISKRN